LKTFFSILKNALVSYNAGVVDKNSAGVNPTIVSFNASAVKIYNATGS
jgi:hypothetical protein